MLTVSEKHMVRHNINTAEEIVDSLLVTELAHLLGKIIQRVCCKNPFKHSHSELGQGPTVANRASVSFI